MNKTLTKALADGQVNVEFRKADGTKRKMRATTNESFINYKPRTKGAVSAPPAGVHRVWDLDINEWRSIRDDRVITFSKV